VSVWNLVENEHNLAIQHSILKQRWLDHAKEAERAGSLAERDRYLARAQEEERLRLEHLENVKKLSGGRVPEPGYPSGEAERKLRGTGFDFPGFPKE